MFANLLAIGETSVYHQFSRLQSMTEWWHWLLLMIACAIVIAYIAVTYYFDSVELPKPLRWSLFALRVLAFAGILFYFLDLEKRSERQIVKNSRALVLIDTSLSMGIQDGSDSSGTRQRRIDAVVGEMQRGDLLDGLRTSHDVVVYRFDQGVAPTEVASLPKTGPSSQTSTTPSSNVDLDTDLRGARITAVAAAIIFGIGLLSFVMSMLFGVRRADGDGSWTVLIGMVAMIAGLIVLAVANLRFPDVPLLATLGLEEATVAPANLTAPLTLDEPASPDETLQIDWPEVLAPRGAETRMADAIRYLANRERGGPLAGIVVVTDGGNNAGSEADAAANLARDAGIPVFAVGIGGDERPANVRVVDLEAPPRVYPGDSFNITGYVQAYGLIGRSVRVELVSLPEANADDETAQETFEEERRVTLGPDGEIVSLKFDVSPTQQGRRTYRLRVIPPAEDQDPRDNMRSATVQIVERKNRVLLFAGGPSREFRFLRNLLYRDRDTTVVVCLQTGQPGMAQEADDLIYEFPSLANELFEYDCIVAFDPDWNELAEDQIQLLERWVAEKAGGLIVVAGPVHTPRWASRIQANSKIEAIKGLYPVIFYSRGSATLSLGRFAAETPWPLQFTQDGRDAEFLWLEDDSLLSEQAWNSFEGVYGYYAVKDPKPGARVYSRFSDPNTSMDGELPIYMAGHFYGAGRVFFQASGEMWRLRAIQDGYFESYYTKLIRWASQGRLLRDSSRGVLLVDKDRCLLGDSISVQAILTDAQHEPLTASQVTASLVAPDGRRSNLELRKVDDAARAGMYSAQFTAVLEGDYRVELQPPHGAADELLRREVRSRIPALETEQPQRNDALLKDLADKTGGAYYVGFDAALNRGGAGRAPISSLLDPQDQVTYLSGTPDKQFERVLMTWLMGLICGVLCLEWLIRRLSKLA
ncbi:MAG: VWA domain-containing protein [Planctomycetaceae bacterium]|nr:VWA domain-containing protein [Planctomycetaceae bacterium]